MPAIIIKPSWEIWDDDNRQNYDHQSSMKHIEKCGRIAWKSKHLITEDSYQKFWDDVVVKKQHRSITEHTAITRTMSYDDYADLIAFVKETSRFETMKFFRVDKVDLVGSNYLISGSQRAWDENQKYEIFQQIVDSSSPKNIEKFKYLIPDFVFWRHRMVTVKFTTDLGTSLELIRHRSLIPDSMEVTMSPTQESSRYVNYKDGGKTPGMTFIDIDSAKSFFKLKNVTDYQKGLDYLHNFQDHATMTYNDLARLGFPAEWIRAVIPKIAKTELVISGFLDQWNDFFKLRVDATAHPQMRELTTSLYVEFKNRGWTPTYD